MYVLLGYIRKASNRQNCKCESPSLILHKQGYGVQSSTHQQRVKPTKPRPGGTPTPTRKTPAMEKMIKEY